MSTPRVPTAPVALPGLRRGGRPQSQTSSSAHSEGSGGGVTPRATPTAASSTAPPRVGTAPHKPLGPSPYESDVMRTVKAKTARPPLASDRAHPQSSSQQVRSPAGLKSSPARDSKNRPPTMRGQMLGAGDVDPYDDFDDDVTMNGSLSRGGAAAAVMHGIPAVVTTSFDSPESVRSTPRVAAVDPNATATTTRHSAAAVAPHGIYDVLNGAAEPTLHSGEAPGLPPSHAGGSSPVVSPNKGGSLRLPELTAYDGKKVPAKVLIAQLDALRATCVQQGRLLDAQQCLDEMKGLAQRHGQHVARDLKAKQSTDKAKRMLQDKHRSQLLKFTALWEEKLNDYDSRSDEAIRTLREKRQREYEDLEDVIRTQLSEQRPHFSSQVVSYKKEVDKLIRNAQYAEAHKAKQTLDAIIQREEARFEELTSIRFAQQTRTLKRRFVAEVRALRMRVQGDREQLVGQRQNDYDTLLQRQANEVLAFEQRVKTEKAKALRDIDRKIAAMSAGGGAKTGFDLDALDRIAENALADLVGPNHAADEDETAQQQAGSAPLQMSFA